MILKTRLQVRVHAGQSKKSAPCFAATPFPAVGEALHAAVVARKTRDV